MRDAVVQYFEGLVEQTGLSWNRFWYVPSDPLPLGVLRIVTGLLALYAHLTLTPDLVRLFAAGGVLDATLVAQWLTTQGADGSGNLGFSYLYWLDSPAELWGAHLLGAIVLAAFTVGIFTRVTSILALLVFVSYVNRALLLTTPLEPVLAVVMFYLCLGPSGDTLSVDALLAGRRKTLPAPLNPATQRNKWSATVALRLLQVHLSVIYLMMGLAKLYGEVWWSGTAIWWLIARPDSRLVDLTPLLAGHLYLVNAWSHLIVLFELAFGVLIWNRWLRPLVLAGTAVHWGLLALATGNVPWCFLMFAAGVAFVPGEVLRKARPRAVEPSPAAERLATSGAEGRAPARGQRV